MELTSEQQEFITEYFGDDDFEDITDQFELVLTAEPTQNFIDACIEYRKIEVWKNVTEIRESQRQKGEPRVTLHIFDFGEFRAVCS